MARSRNYDEVMAEQLKKDRDLCKQVLLVALEEEPIEEALLYLIQSYGVKEYSDLIGMDKGNLLRSLRKGNPSFMTLKRILDPLGLTLGIIEKKKKKKKKRKKKAA